MSYALYGHPAYSFNFAKSLYGFDRLIEAVVLSVLT